MGSNPHADDVDQFSAETTTEEHTIPIAPELYELLEEGARRHGVTVRAIVEAIIEDAIIEDVITRMELAALA